MAEMNREITDSELIQNIRSGDKRSYSVLVKRHQKSLLRMSVRFVKDLDTAEDVVQEAFIKAFERLGSFEGRASFKSWLFQIAVNTAKNKLRERKNGTLDVHEMQLGVAAMAESDLVHRSVAQVIGDLVETLPHRQKTALVLRVYEDMSFHEIADIMECPYDTAKANYRHALMKLKADLENHKDLQSWTQEIGGFVTEMNRKFAEAEA